MKYLIYLVAIIILLGLNLGIFNNLQIKSQIPNLLFLFSFCFSLEKKDHDFFFISLVSGIFLDFYSTSFFGSFTLAFLTIGLCMHLFSNNVLVMDFNWKTLSIALVVCLFLLNLIVWFYGLAAFKLNWISGYTSFKIFMSDLLPDIFYNLLFLYPIYTFSNFLKRSIESLAIRGRGIVR